MKHEPSARRRSYSARVTSGRPKHQTSTQHPARAWQFAGSSLSGTNLVTLYFSRDRNILPCVRTPSTISLTACVTLAWWISTGCAAEGRSPESWAGFALPEPLQKPQVLLTDAKGLPFDFREGTHGKLTLLFFGYTHCPDVCPVQMANLARVIGNLSASDASRISVVFVTTDPARDTPERLQEWLGQFSPSFIGLTGDSTTIRRMQQELQVPPAVIESVPTPQGGYSVAHAGYVIVFTPDNLARFVYPFGTRQEDWARDLPRLLAEEWTL